MIIVDEIVPMNFKMGESETIWAYVLNECPPVISVGQLCERDGWGFYWPPYSKYPFHVSPDGSMIVSESRNYTPWTPNQQGYEPYYPDDFSKWFPEWMFPAKQRVATPAPETKKKTRTIGNQTDPFGYRR